MKSTFGKENIKVGTLPYPLAGSALRFDHKHLQPVWRNWQTQQIQNLPLARAWGFESLLRHQPPGYPGRARRRRSKDVPNSALERFN